MRSSSSPSTLSSTPLVLVLLPLALALVALVPSGVSGGRPAPFTELSEEEFAALSYYDIMGVERDGAWSEKELKKKYRLVARVNHPDKFMDAEVKEAAQLRFVRIVKAYEVLNDRVMRQQYDEMLRRGHKDHDEYEWQEMNSKSDFDAAWRRYNSTEWDDIDTMSAWTAIIGTAVLVVLPAGYIWWTTRSNKVSARVLARSKIKDVAAAEERERAYREQLEKQQSAVLDEAKKKAEQRSDSLRKAKSESKKEDSIYYQQALERRRKQRELAKKNGEADKTKIKSGAWSTEEMSLLAKGIAKYPGGTPKRWEVIANFVNGALTDGRRTVKDVQKTAYELGRRKLVVKDSIEDAYDRYVSKMSKSDKVQRNKVEMDKRAAADSSASVENRQRFAQKLKQSSTQQPASTTSAAKKQKQQTEEQKQKPADAVDDWTAEQQRDLELALRKYPASLSKQKDVNGDVVDRWRLIAASVEGKSKRDCVLRFKQIRAQILEAKKKQQKKQSS